MQQDPIKIPSEEKAEDDYSFNDIWNNLSEMFLQGIARAENQDIQRCKNA